MLLNLSLCQKKHIKELNKLVHTLFYYNVFIIHVVNKITLFTKKKPVHNTLCWNVSYVYPYIK